MASNAAPVPSTYYLGVRKQGISFEHFKDYYENSHIPMVMKLIEGEKYIAKYTRSYFQRTGDSALEGYDTNAAGTWDFDVITHLVPKSREALEKIIENFQKVQDIVVKDEETFIDREKSKTYFVTDVKGGEYK